MQTISQTEQQFFNQDINALIQEEFMALECYKKALHQLDKVSVPYGHLYRFKKDHEEALRYWRSQSNIESTVDRRRNTRWGSVYQKLTNPKKEMRDLDAVSILKEGERSALTTYQKMLLADHLSHEHKKVIKKELIPSYEYHLIGVINTMNHLTKE